MEQELPIGAAGLAYDFVRFLYRPHERLKSFILKKYGEGYVQHVDLVELISIIDSLAVLASLKQRDSL